MLLEDQTWHRLLSRAWPSLVGGDFEEASQRCLTWGPPRVLSMFLMTTSQLTLSKSSLTLACLATKSARFPKGTDWKSSTARPPGLISAASQTQPLLSLRTFWDSSTPKP